MITKTGQYPRRVEIQTGLIVVNGQRVMTGRLRDVDDDYRHLGEVELDADQALRLISGGVVTTVAELPTVPERWSAAQRASLELQLTIPAELNQRIHGLPNEAGDTLGDKILRLLEAGVAAAEQGAAEASFRDYLAGRSADRS